MQYSIYVLFNHVALIAFEISDANILYTLIFSLSHTHFNCLLNFKTFYFFMLL